MKVEEYTFFLIKYKNRYAVQRCNEEAFKGLWEFPKENGFLTFDEVKEIIPSIVSIELGVTNTYNFPDKKWFMNSYYIEVNKKLPNYHWIALEEIKLIYTFHIAFQPFIDYLRKK